jgi:eukaryotic-like serine/threonine-protein kinase
VRCPDKNAIVAFADGQLAEAARSEVAIHLASCETCLALVAGAVGAESARPDRALDLERTPPLEKGSAAGRYLILNLVGRGGMGEVYAAYDPKLDRRVALKLLNERAASPVSAERLLREAKATARLSHPSVVAIYDAGEIGDRVFLAMEFVEGQTLADWLAESPRSWREICDVFVAAGQGLAAAHDAGLVHRDFKPQNVMIGNDGSTRVADFGLARLVQEDLGSTTGADAGSPDGVSPPSSATLTKTGTLLGTPAYMAPEQFQLRPANARSDQFSFCVALYEALYGTRPLLAHLAAGSGPSASSLDPRKQPRGGGTPLWLRQVVMRGLSVDPAARWGSMQDLTRRLERDPARQRRRWAFMATVALVTVAAAIGVGRASHSTAALCRAGPAHLADTWAGAETPSGRAQRETSRASFLATGLPGATEIWDRVTARLDHYAGGWLTMYRDACEATSLRGEQSPEVLDLRMTCLEDGHAAMRALVDVLKAADKQTVNNAVDAVGALPRLDRCADIRLLRAVVEPPRDARTRAQIDDLRRRAAVAKALHDTGRSQLAVEQGRRLVAEARALGYAPLLAELLALAGTLQESATFDSASVKIWQEAIWTGLRARRDDLAAEAATMLGGIIGAYQHRPEEGERWLDLANALVDRMGEGHDRLRSWILQGQAIVAESSDPETALGLTRKALEIKKRVLQPDDPDIAHSLHTEAEELHRTGDDVAALDVAREARRLYAEAYGPRSAYVANMDSNTGEYLVALGRPAESLPLFRDALSHWQAEIGADHPFLAFPLTGLGRALLALGRQAEARAPLERALRLREREALDPALLAETRFALAQAFWATGESRRGVAMAAMARATYAQAAAGGSAEKQVVAWLADHRAEPR